MFPCLERILHHPARKTWYKGGETEIKVHTENVSCLIQGGKHVGPVVPGMSNECELASCCVVGPPAQTSFSLPVPDPTKLPSLPDSVSDMVVITAVSTLLPHIPSLNSILSPLPLTAQPQHFVHQPKSPSAPGHLRKVLKCSTPVVFAVQH